VRVEEAKRLLCVSDLSVTGVAASVGYGDLTTFNRVFRRWEGVCPREYRRLLFSVRDMSKTTNAESGSPDAENETRNAENSASGASYRTENSF
jgi:AraC-like DNA-binding protein